MLERVSSGRGKKDGPKILEADLGSRGNPDKGSWRVHHTLDTVALRICAIMGIYNAGQSNIVLLSIGVGEKGFEACSTLQQLTRMLMQYP